MSPTFKVIRDPANIPLTIQTWEDEFLFYCTSAEAPTRLFHNPIHPPEHVVQLNFASKRFVLQWDWTRTHPLDAVRDALEVGALTQVTVGFQIDWSRRQESSETAAADRGATPGDVQ